MLIQLTRASRVDGKYVPSDPVFVNPANVALVEHATGQPTISWLTMSVSQNEDGGEAVNFPVVGTPSEIAQKVGIGESAPVETCESSR